MLRIFNFVLSLCNQFSTSTFDLRFAFLVPPQSENASYAPAINPTYYTCIGSWWYIVYLHVFI